MHSEHGRILLCVKLVHIYACNDIPSEKCAKQCKLQRELGTPNALASNEYGAFANAISAREFLMAIKNHTRKHLYDEIHGSPYFSILIDEVTSRTLEKHLIIYVLYFSEGGKGEPHYKFV